MKKFILLSSILFSFSTHASDWDLFPYQQISYYFKNTMFFENNIRTHVMDSIKVNGTDSILYFNKNLNLQGAGSCYEEALDHAFIGVGIQDDDFIDSLVKRNDTVFFYHTWSSLPFYFLPHALTGESWTITSTFTGNDYNQITITCVAIQSETFFGLTDSVKIFNLIPNGSSPNQTPVSNFQIKLSKNYGLIEFVPFYLFLNHSSSLAFYNLKLIGLSTGTINYGYEQPKFEDYFHLSAGDILLWYRSHYPFNIMQPTFHLYYRDSILQSLVTSDSIVYHFDRTVKDMNNTITQLNNQTVTFTKKGFENIFDAPPKWIGFGENHLGYSPMQNSIPIWYTDFLGFRIDSLTIDTVFQYSAWGGERYIDTTQCQQMWFTDLMFSFIVDTRAGIIQQCWDNFAYDCTTLIGYKINGIQSGSLSLSIDELNKINTNFIYPNPAHDIIKIDLTFNKIAELKIHDVVGKLIKQGLIDDKKEFDISELNPGIYFVKVTTEKQEFVSKLIKQ